MAGEGLGGAPEGGSEAAEALQPERRSNGGQIAHYFAWWLGTFAILVLSAVVIDWINRHDPRNTADEFRQQAEIFRSDILTQRFALQTAANNQRSASRVLMDALASEDGQSQKDEVERDKQNLSLASDGYEGTLDNIRALLEDAVDNFGLGASNRPESSQLATFFYYQHIMLNKAWLISHCLRQNADDYRRRQTDGGATTSANPQPAQDATAPAQLAGSRAGETPAAPAAPAEPTKCAAFNRHSSFELDEQTLNRLDFCETEFGRGLVEATRILGRAAKQYGGDTAKLGIQQRLWVEFSGQHGVARARSRRMVLRQRQTHVSVRAIGAA